MGKSKKKQETTGLQPKGGARAVQDARAAAEGINLEGLGEGIATKADVKEAKKRAAETHKAEVAKVKEKQKEKRAEKKKKGGIIKGIKDMGSELKKVRWPELGRVVKQTGVVLSVVVIFSLVVFGIDFGLGRLYDLLMSSVQGS